MKRTKLLSTFLKIAGILQGSLVSAQFKAYNDRNTRYSYIDSNTPVFISTNLEIIDTQPDSLLNCVYSYCIDKQGLFQEHNDIVLDFQTNKPLNARDERVIFMGKYCNIFQVLFPFTKPEFPIQNTKKGSFFLFLVSLQESKNDIALLMYLLLLCEGVDMRMDKIVDMEDLKKEDITARVNHLNIIFQLGNNINTEKDTKKKPQNKMATVDRIYLPVFEQVLGFFQEYKIHPKVDLKGPCDMPIQKYKLLQHIHPSTKLLVRMYVYYYCNYFNCWDELFKNIYFILRPYSDYAKNNSSTKQSADKDCIIVDVFKNENEDSNIQENSSILSSEEGVKRKSIKTPASKAYYRIFRETLHEKSNCSSMFNKKFFTLLYATHPIPYSTTNNLPFYTKTPSGTAVDQFPFRQSIYSSKCCDESLLVIFSCLAYNPETFSYNYNGDFYGDRIYSFLKKYKRITASRCNNLNMHWSKEVISTTFNRIGTTAKSRLRKGTINFLNRMRQLMDGPNCRLGDTLTFLIQETNKKPIEPDYIERIQTKLTTFFKGYSTNNSLTVRVKNLTIAKVENMFDFFGDIELEYEHNGISGGININVALTGVKVTLLESKISNPKKRKEALEELQKLCWYPESDAKSLFIVHTNTLIQECNYYPKNTTEPVAGPSGISNSNRATRI
ncbi:uncharacterized protein NESG_01394 [Nematocida ausubeli]|uniref:Uncharacterized protein n=1 Tax=Nematocida ausubeli (strain ATCC PRA-371 / ERTm2) TaxID=1913371 RepID=A0A086J2A6_NEMA1|nr:uncharacterized protein NESG_01394 [Nematocida ausubeli]KFG26274.1 hypothetical protein NESG_01394 [Nematocida ausubeli]